MHNIQLDHKTFAPYLSRKQIADRVKHLATELQSSFMDENTLVFVIMNGAFVFAADLVREFTFACPLRFIKLASYEGTNSTGKVIFSGNDTFDMVGKKVLIVEDIVDTGRTREALLNKLRQENPKEMRTVALLFKPDAYLYDNKPEYIGFDIPNAFVVGYGMDIDGRGRNLGDVYMLNP